MKYTIARCSSQDFAAVGSRHYDALDILRKTAGGIKTESFVKEVLQIDFRASRFRQTSSFANGRHGYP